MAVPPLLAHRDVLARVHARPGVAAEMTVDMSEHAARKSVREGECVTGG
jgi:hypothetical protein